jgi:hypothetical protein
MTESREVVVVRGRSAWSGRGLDRGAGDEVNVDARGDRSGAHDDRSGACPWLSR